MGAEMSCLQLKKMSSSTKPPTTNDVPTRMSMPFDAPYTPRASNANSQVPTTTHESHNTPQAFHISNAHTNTSVTRRDSTSRSERRRSNNRRFSFSISHGQEGEINLSELNSGESATRPNPANGRSRFSFTWKVTKNVKGVTSPIGKLYIDAKPDPSMLSYTETTPKGADAVRFPHFCPICYRHFADIYRTKCCGHNICYGCSQRHIESKRKIARKESMEHGNRTRMSSALDINIPCPNCNSDHVEFERIHKGDKSRMYCESPTTKKLMERSRQQNPVLHCNTPSMISQSIPV